MMRLLTIFFLQLFTLSCNSSMDKNKDFVDKYNNENFNDFINTAIHFRSSDNQGGLIIFANDNKQPDLNNGVYIITIDKEKETIKKTDCTLLKDSSIIDKRRLENLALKFLKYPINFLSVDKHSNVLINLKANERPNLIRFADIKYKTNEYKDWVLIKDNWYQMK